MGLYLWDDEYSIGIAEIDQQHKQIFATMQSLHQAMLAGKSGTRVEPALLELIQVSDMHFRTEEVLMAFHHFPDLENHRSEHRLITGQLQTFLEDHRSGRAGLIVDMLEYLEDWQGIHVMQHDMRYRDYLMQQWGIRFRDWPRIDAAEHEVLETTRQGRDERRYPRVLCSIAVELRSSLDAPIVYAKCVNISRSGAFLRTWSPLKANTTAVARFYLGSFNPEVRICVRRSEPCIGMGISFLDTVPQQLQEMIKELEDAQRYPRSQPTDLTCDRLLHDCMHNLAALEDVISDAEITNNTAIAIRSLLSRASRLENLTRHTVQENNSENQRN